MESSKRIKINLTTPKTILELPSDLLLLILSRLDQKDLQSLSVVSKPFLHLSNRFIRKLTFKTLPEYRSFRKIFTRFSSVNQITLKTKRVTGALIAISKSQLNLEALNIITSDPTYPDKHQMLSLSGKLKIKYLVFCRFPKIKADQVVEFIRLFPSLEELYFGRYYEWDDTGIESIALMLPNLRKINLSGNSHLTDRALYALSANCVNLEYIGIKYCDKLTPQGFCTFLRGCRNLRYLDLPSFSPYTASDLLIAETVSACENVHHLSINFSLIKDDTLGIIAKSPASLKSLKMKFFLEPPKVDYTMTGLSAMLCAFQNLTRLDICLPHHKSDKLLDKKMSELVKSLPCLTGVSITSNCLMYATFFSLIENCPMVECILLNMEVSSRDRRCKVPVPRLIRKNYTVKYIRLIPSPNASFEIALVSFCPCLRNCDGSFHPDPKVFFPTNPVVEWMKRGG